MRPRSFRPSRRLAEISRSRFATRALLGAAASLFALPWLLVLGPLAAAAQAQDSGQPNAVARQGQPLPASGWVDLDPLRFPVPAELQDNVAFWTKVYTGYDNHVVLLHDDLHMGIIYAALDFGELDQDPKLSSARKQRARRDRIRQARQKYRQILTDLAAGRTSSSWPNDHARVEALFDDVPGDRGKYSAAIDRMRTQTCLRNRFAEAIERSGRYMEDMELIFRRKDLPIELTRLPFVESLFQLGARSSASAGGIWQFVPSTAKVYMTMTAEADQRFDPLTATAAAAELLSENYAALGAWPVAITAYNHGRNGMKRAVRRLGTRDLGEIVTHYRSRLFGFASRNFYAEFVAAYRAYENRHHFFPGVVPEPRLTFDEVRFDHYFPLHTVVQQSGASLDQVRLLNPALSRQIWADQLFFPKQASLRVPVGTADSVRAAYESLPANRKSQHQVGLRYTVRRGDTLGVIARRHGTSISALRRANNLPGSLIRVGQRLLIPGPGGVTAASSSRPAAAANSGYHVVRRGDTLTGIAQRYGTSVRAVQSANGLRDADLLKVGQNLRIPGGKGLTHTVRRGETLAKIAQRYGVTVNDLRRANRIRGDLIRPSQVLLIP